MSVEEAKTFLQTKISLQAAIDAFFNDGATGVEAVEISNDNRDPSTSNPDVYVSSSIIVKVL